MSKVAQNGCTGAEGKGNSPSLGSDNFKDYLTQALALKLNIKTSQQANEKSLHSIINAKRSSADLKQAVQARAAVYGPLLNASWFAKNYNLSSKTKDINDRRLARASLVGAVLFVAQLGLQNLQTLLRSGDSSVLDSLKPDTVGSVTQLKKALSKAPLFQVLEIANKSKLSEVLKGFSQHTEDLDYLQSLINSIGKHSALNPSLNAVCDAFIRRRFRGCFKTLAQGVELDTLLNQATKSSNDDDALWTKVDSNQTYQSNRKCWLFQQGRCSFPNCRFRHKCAVCNAVSHGRDNCPRRSTTQQSSEQTNSAAAISRPPNPRYRRDRAVT